MLRSKLYFKPVNLRLFDGEATGGEGTMTGSEGAANSQQPGGESESVVVYGKGDTEIDAEANSNNDNNNSSNASEESSMLSLDLSKLTTPETRAEAWKKVKESFKDEFTNDFQSHFDRRFKEHKTLESKATQYEPIVEALMKYHKADSIEALQKIVEDDILSDLAEQEGFANVQQYKDHLDGEKAKKTLADIKAENAKSENMKAQIDTWTKQGLELRDKLSKNGIDFDLPTELKNKDFVDKLRIGLNVEEAYNLIHMNEILGKASERAAKTSEENVVKNLQAKKARITENGTKPTPGVIRKADPSKFTDKDLEEIAERVAKGEIIRF
jgi:hypothetical protein